MSATDELRRLLDERGVEHYDGTECTLWGYEDYNEFTGIYRFSADETSDGHMQVRLWYVTPEQAIAATLGDIDATVTRQGDAGTCHDTQEDEERFCCSECGKKSYIVTQYHEFDEYGTKTAGWIEVCTPHFCPNCGRRITEVDE